MSNKDTSRTILSDHMGTIGGFLFGIGASLLIFLITSRAPIGPDYQTWKFGLGTLLFFSIPCACAGKAVTSKSLLLNLLGILYFILVSGIVFAVYTLTHFNTMVP